jgi:hypothetical protein
MNLRKTLDTTLVIGFIAGIASLVRITVQRIDGLGRAMRVVACIGPGEGLRQSLPVARAGPHFHDIITNKQATLICYL